MICDTERALHLSYVTYWSFTDVWRKFVRNTTAFREMLLEKAVDLEGNGATGEWFPGFQPGDSSLWARDSKSSYRGCQRYREAIDPKGVKRPKESLTFLPGPVLPHSKMNENLKFQKLILDTNFPLQGNWFNQLKNHQLIFSVHQIFISSLFLAEKLFLQKNQHLIPYLATSFGIGVICDDFVSSVLTMRLKGWW